MSFQTIPKLIVLLPGYCPVNKFLAIAGVEVVTTRHKTSMLGYEG